MYKILICDPLSDTALQILDSSPDVEYKQVAGLQGKQIISMVHEYNALIVRSATKVTAAIIAAAENLKVIGRAGSGLDNIDAEYAEKKGIKILNTPGTNAPAVAEFTIGLLFSLARTIPQANISMRNNKWAKKDFQGIELQNNTLGIIGCGTIGKLVAKKAFALGMNVIINNRSEVSLPEIEFEQLSLQKILTHSDFITVHLPSDAKGLIGKEELKLVKDNAFIINTARGGIIKENDLLSSLESGKIAGVALDVFESEPNFNVKLVNHPKVIATPHIGAATSESQERVGVQIVDHVLEYLRSKYIFL